jgi:RNA polymerase sigma factor (sigma-70 family)
LEKNKSRLGLLSREDLIQEGAIGLQRAVAKYNIGIGGKFSSYAVYWIRASVLRCIDEHGDLVRAPEHILAAIRKMSSAVNRLCLQVDGDDIAKGVFANNEQPWKEAQAAKVLTEEAGLTDRQLREAMRVKYRRVAGSVSFEDWMQRGELQSDVTTNSDSTAASVDSEKLRVELSKYLRPKEMEALTLRFGLEDAPAAQEEVKTHNYQAEAELLVFGEEPPERKKSGETTFNEIGNSMSVSAEYGRRLVHKALSKLQKAAAEGRLELALLF